MNLRLNLRIIFRYIISVLIGCLCVATLKIPWSSSFDKVASTTMFAAIISVANEDESLGPVIHKAMSRLLGACLGGLCGYMSILVVKSLSSSNSFLAIVLVPTVFVALFQVVVESTYASAGCIEKYKLKHFAIQLQVAFGVVYLGAVVDGLGQEHGRDLDSFMVAVARTTAVVLGVLALVISSLCVYPETSMYATAACLSDCLELLGSLAEDIAGNRIQGKHMPRYDHHVVLFSSQPHLDPQAKAIASIELKLTRATSLLPFLHVEPTWVPGLPLQLLSAQFCMAANWKPFLSVLASRVGRLRCSIVAMDSNVRILSEQADSEIKAKIAEKMRALTISVHAGLSLVADYVKSPYTRPAAQSVEVEQPIEKKTAQFWMGDLSAKTRLYASIEVIQANIRDFTVAFEEGLREDNHVHVQRLQGAPSPVVDVTQFDRHSSALNHNMKARSYKEFHVASYRESIGHMLDFYFKTGPNRTFCNLCIQVSIQATSLLMEAIEFIESIESEGENLSPKQRAAAATTHYEVETSSIVPDFIISDSERDSHRREVEMGLPVVHTTSRDTDIYNTPEPY